MSAQNYWENVQAILARLKSIKATVDTCPLCWARSGLPAVVFRGGPEEVCDTCLVILKQIARETN